MSRYIVFPKEESVARNIIEPHPVATPVFRDPIVEHFKGVFEKDPEHELLLRVFTESIRRVPLLGDQPKIQSNEITGISVIEGPDELAKEMENRLSNYYLIKDTNFNLIDLIDLGHHIDNISPEHLWHLEKIKLSQARERGLGTGKGIKVAVLDTGINGSHPELRGKVTISYDKYMHKLSNPEDTDGHGTQVASLICGNTIGVAPDVKIIDVVLLERKYGKLVDFIWVLGEILKYHTDVPVVNISGGLYHSHKDHEDPRLHTLIQRFSDKQIFLVVAAGNRGVGKTISPGIFREVISVGATTKNDEVWKKSGGDKLVDSKGEYTVPDLVAPGASIYVPAKQGGFERVSGTSMAAPIVSGIIALLIEKFRNTYNYFTVDDVLEEMYKTCVDLQLPRERQGKGLVAFSG